MRLSGKAALVTGGAQGLGLAVARRLASEGAIVYIGDLNAELGRRSASLLGEELGAKVSYLELDVSSEESWKSALGTIVSASGGLDILVNNAGINIRKPIEEMEVEEFDRMMAVNVRGPFVGIKQALPLMRAAGGGSIVNISSVCGLVGHKYTPEAYTTTKGALTLLTKSIASRYAKDNVRCNSVHPSTVDTPLVQALFKDPQRKRERLEEVPLGRLATAADVAAAVLFLVSPEASFLNGVALPVDGGVTAY
jgi:Dehydrogenases with different specificities (related to short-chain alcohol dehydrogenases)